MARRFTRASSEKIQWSTAGQHFTNWGFGTLAFYIRKASDPAAFSYLMANRNAAENDSGFGFSINNVHKLNSWSATAGTDQASSSTILAADGWAIVGATKPTGGTLRFHFYKQSANTWTHENGSTQADNTSTSSTPFVTVGMYTLSGSSGDPFDGDIAAVMALTTTVMTDSEFERLPAGLWDRWLSKSTDLLIEWPSGRDPLVTGVNMTRSNGIGSMVATTTTGTTRTVVRDPPGFRFSRFTRRR